MLNVGILNPDWTLMRHNTDHVCVMDLAEMSEFEPELQLSFVGTRWQYLKANANQASQRLWRKWLFPSITLRATQLRSDVLYRYGPEAQGLELAGAGHPPLLSTAGYPSLRSVIARGEIFMEAQARHLAGKMRNAAVVHFHTDAMREEYLLRQPEQAERCITIPFFLPQLDFLSAEAVREKFDQPETTLLFVGADGQRKGIEELCEALDLIAPQLQRQQVQVVIVSKHKPRCHRFTGIRHETWLARDVVQTLMRQAHIYCMVPRYESFGLVFVEAMAAGCAVIADDDLPRQEILDHGRCGVLLPAQQPQALAQAISGLLEDRPRARDLALAALARAKTRYAPEPVAQAYAHAFQRMLA